MACVVVNGVNNAEQVQELEDLVYELSVNLDTVKDTQSYMKAIKQYHLQGERKRVRIT